MTAIRIGILGDFNPEFHSHHATNACLQHAAAAVGLTAESHWVPTPDLDAPAAPGRLLADSDGLWASSGSPYRSMTGMLRGIEFARTRGRPFVAT